MVVARVSPVCRLCKPESVLVSVSRVSVGPRPVSGVQSGPESAEGGERSSPLPGLLDGT